MSREPAARAAPVDGATPASRALPAAATVAALTLLRATAPHLGHRLRAGDNGIQALLTAAVLLGLAAAPLAGRLADRRGRDRVAAAGLATALTATALSAAAPSVTVFAALVAIAGVAAGCQFLSDLAVLGAGSVSGIATYALALPGGVAVGAGVAAALEGLAAGPRGTLAASALAVIAVPLAVRAARRRHSGGGGPAGGATAGESVAIGTTAQRVRRLSGWWAVIGLASVVAFALVAAPTIVAALLRGHWHQALAARGRTLLLVSSGSVAGCVACALGGERVWRAGPATALRAIAAAIALFGLLLWAGAAAPALWLAELSWAVAVAAVAGATVMAVRGIAAVALPEATATTLGTLAADGVAIGGIGAMLVLAAVAHAAGPRTALLVAGLASCAVAALLAGSARSFSADVATTASGVARRAAGPAGAGAGRSPALEVGEVNFSYGRRQVLFGVSLRVDEGEIAALLGANGAGKSTLLRLVAGLDHPSSGSITVFGRDTTYAEAEQQVAGGVAMLAGGRMSFPGLTVGENLRIAAFTFRRDRARQASAVEEVAQLFPVLGERLDQRAGTLSGGEQQMLALGRVLLTRPRLLLIDELSLGLAPRVVEVLLDVIRRVNEQGTTVLLVEQSANLALGIARHAFFLERGQVRFDGPTSELMGRDDLLRPVFLPRPA